MDKQILDERDVDVTALRHATVGAGDLRNFDVKALSEVVYESQHKTVGDVVVVVPLYNYSGTIIEALESVVKQDLPRVSVVVVDDCSTDDGGEKAALFLEKNAARFTHALVIRHYRNQGLSMSRNSGIAASREPFLFMLDADNRLRPGALSHLLQSLRYSDAAFAYSQLIHFGDEVGIGVADLWDPNRLSDGNYIDAMALLRRHALIAAGGYAVLADDHGWEDYDLWCRFATLGFEGVFLPELLCEYRVHSSSMLRTRTNVNADKLIAEMRLRHPALFHRGEKRIRT